MRRSIAFAVALALTATVLLPIVTEGAQASGVPIASLGLVRQQVLATTNLPAARVKDVPPRAPGSIFHTKIFFFLIVLEKFVRTSTLARMHEQLLRNRPAPVREVRAS